MGRPTVRFRGNKQGNISWLQVVYVLDVCLKCLCAQMFGVTKFVNRGIRKLCQGWGGGYRLNFEISLFRDGGWGTKVYIC